MNYSPLSSPPISRAFEAIPASPNTILPIPAALRDVGGAITTIENCLLALTEKLNPILYLSGPVPTVPAKDEPRENSPHYYTLREFENRLQDIVRVIEWINSRVEA